MGKLFHWLFLSCKEATLYMELKESNQLSLSQRLKLTVHLFICKYCKIYNKQRNFINKLINSSVNKEQNTPEPKQIEALKTSIKSELSKNK